MYGTIRSSQWYLSVLCQSTLAETSSSLCGWVWALVSSRSPHAADPDNFAPCLSLLQTYSVNAGHSAVGQVRRGVRPDHWDSDDIHTYILSNAAAAVRAPCTARARGCHSTFYIRRAAMWNIQCPCHVCVCPQTEAT
ncbi:hypothetical protein PENSPDRAFT_352283 [Peniophora sp. CONT]|nr:hypothetical protein PENSPDRAFT_352283 [Peniophora sp. CONT]